MVKISFERTFTGSNLLRLPEMLIEVLSSDRGGGLERRTLVIRRMLIRRANDVCVCAERPSGYNSMRAVTDGMNKTISIVDSKQDMVAHL